MRVLARWADSSLQLGPIGPFRAAIALSALALALVLRWDENYGDDVPAASGARADDAAVVEASAESGGVVRTLGHALRLMGADPRLWMLGVVQAAFEGGMFSWVSVWVRMHARPPHVLVGLRLGAHACTPPPREKPSPHATRTVRDGTCVWQPRAPRSL